jgi:hypothetical protein
MNPRLLLAAIACTFCGAALAAPADDRGITTNTDPAHVAEVERHAQALGFDPNGTTGSSGTSAGTTSSGSTKHTQHHKSHKTGKSKSHGAKSGGAAPASGGSTTQ